MQFLTFSRSPCFFSAQLFPLKVVHPWNICQFAKLRDPTETGQFLHPPPKFENLIIAIFKSSSQVKRVGMSMIFLCTELILSKCHGS
jgi:hypothetical protein